MIFKTASLRSDGVAEMAGLGGRIKSESLAGLNRNDWPNSPDYA